MVNIVANSIWLNGMPFKRDLEKDLRRIVNLQNDDNFLPSTNKNEVLKLESYHDLEKIKEYGFIKVGKNEKNSIEKILKNLFIK